MPAIKVCRRSTGNLTGQLAFPEFHVWKRELAQGHKATRPSRFREKSFNRAIQCGLINPGSATAALGPIFRREWISHDRQLHSFHSFLDSDHNYNHNVVLIVIGEFEYLILSAAAQLGEEAYGAAMREVIETTGGRTCSLGALYTTLDRLETKGLVETWMSAPTQQRGGRAKRMVRVTGKGAREAREFYQAVIRISRGTTWGKSRGSRMPGESA